MNTVPGLTSGWLVRVSAADGFGGRTERDYWVGEAEKAAAERLVRANSASGDRVRGVKPLFISELQSFGVHRGEVKYRAAAPEAAPRTVSTRAVRDDRPRLTRSPTTPLNSRRVSANVPGHAAQEKRVADDEVRQGDERKPDGAKPRRHGKRKRVDLQNEPALRNRRRR